MYNSGADVVNSEVVGLAPGANPKLNPIHNHGTVGAVGNSVAKR
jgi:hypothetical protein